jgi:hypothetical protein
MQTIHKHATESIVLTFDFSAKLADGDLLTGTPTVDAVSGTITIDDNSIAINDSEVTVDSEAVAADKGVNVRISAGTAGTKVQLIATATTDDGDTLVVECIVVITGGAQE